MTEVQINGFKRHKTIIKILSFLEYKTAKSLKFLQLLLQRAQSPWFTLKVKWATEVLWNANQRLILFSVSFIPNSKNRPRQKPSPLFPLIISYGYFKINWNIKEYLKTKHCYVLLNITGISKSKQKDRKNSKINFSLFISICAKLQNQQCLNPGSGLSMAVYIWIQNLRYLHITINKIETTM